MERPAGLRIGCHGSDRLAVVAALAQRNRERNLRKQRHTEFVGEFLATARAEQFVALAVVAGEPRHVLDDPAHGQVDLLCHRGRETSDFLCGLLRRGHNKYLCLRKVLTEAQRDVAGARRHVDEQVVGFVPEHVGEELLECLVQHRPAPDDCLSLGNEVADRDAPHAVVLGRQQHVVDDHRVAVCTEHARNGETVDVGVDDAHRVAARGERNCEVGGDAALAHTALARRDQQRSGLRVFRGERHRTPLGVTVCLVAARSRAGVSVQHLSHVRALGIGHDPEVDAHRLAVDQR